MRPQAVALLDMLRAHPEGVSALDILRYGHIYRASARVLELKEAGYPVQTRRKAHETATYWLPSALRPVEPVKPMDGLGMGVAAQSLGLL
jgi:hypothetical protein